MSKLTLRDIFGLSGTNKLVVAEKKEVKPKVRRRRFSTEVVVMTILTMCKLGEDGYSRKEQDTILVKVFPELSKGRSHHAVVSTLWKLHQKANDLGQYLKENRLRIVSK